jgi:hypothetical protein
MQMRFRFLCAAGVGLAAACYQNDVVGPPADKAAASVTLSPADTTVTTGDSVEFQALVRDSSGAPITVGVTVSWSVSDTALAAIVLRGAQQAAVRARAPGTDTLYGAFQGSVGRATIVVH